MARNPAKASDAVSQKWTQEQQLVREGRGTRDWTPEQQLEILLLGKVYDENGEAFQGHHMKSVEAFPEYQGDPDNIQLLSKAEHLEAHDQNWLNATNGYYDPVTKQTTDFGSGKYTPCKIIELTEKCSLNENADAPASGAGSVSKNGGNARKESSGMDDNMDPKHYQNMIEALRLFRKNTTETCNELISASNSCAAYLGDDIASKRISADAVGAASKLAELGVEAARIANLMEKELNSAMKRMQNVWRDDAAEGGE